MHTWEVKLEMELFGDSALWSSAFLGFSWNICLLLHGNPWRWKGPEIKWSSQMEGHCRYTCFVDKDIWLYKGGVICSRWDKERTLKWIPCTGHCAGTHINMTGYSLVRKRQKAKTHFLSSSLFLPFGNYLQNTFLSSVKGLLSLNAS
jgi:hypothetical protein